MLLDNVKGAEYDFLYFITHLKGSILPLRCSAGDDLRGIHLSMNAI